MAPRRCDRRYDCNSERYDVAVVGAGPAGSAAARAAATAGLRVLLLDARTEIGRPVQCAEYVSRLIQREVSVPVNCIAQRTETLRTHLPGGEQHQMAAPGYVLRRDLFDQHLAVLAESAGAELALGTRALKRTPRGLLVRRRRLDACHSERSDSDMSLVTDAGQQDTEIVASVIVGADGAHSTVGRWVGQRDQSYVVAAQYELAMSEASAETEVYFDAEYVGGYAWFFPKGQTANVGVGVAAGSVTSAAAALEHFIDRLRADGRIKRIDVVARTGGFIPVGGLLKLQAENVLLAGDAGGCVHPVTGAGILFAIISGRLAGEIAAKAIGAGDLGILAGYEARCREAIGGPIERGLAARGRLIDGWSDDAALLSELLRQNWIAFEGYGQFTTRKGG